MILFCRKPKLVPEINMPDHEDTFDDIDTLVLKPNLIIVESLKLSRKGIVSRGYMLRESIFKAKVIKSNNDNYKVGLIVYLYLSGNYVNVNTKKCNIVNIDSIIGTQP